MDFIGSNDDNDDGHPNPNKSHPNVSKANRVKLYFDYPNPPQSLATSGCALHIAQWGGQVAPMT